MLNLALIALFGLFAFVLAYFALMSRRAARFAAARDDVDEQARAIGRRAETIGTTLVEMLVSGGSPDRAITEYQSARAACFPRDEVCERPWSWESDDLVAWAKREKIRRMRAVNRTLLFPAVTTLLAIVTVTCAALAVYYNVALSRPTANPTPFLPTAPDPFGDQYVTDSQAEPDHDVGPANEGMDGPSSPSTTTNTDTTSPANTPSDPNPTTQPESTDANQASGESS